MSALVFVVPAIAFIGCNGAIGLFIYPPNPVLREIGTARIIKHMRV